MRENVACGKSPAGNTAYLRYTLPSTEQSYRFYDGDLVGLPQDDVNINCTPIQANPDTIISRDIPGSTGSNLGSLAITTYDLLANDTLS